MLRGDSLAVQNIEDSDVVLEECGKRSVESPAVTRWTRDANRHRHVIGESGAVETSARTYSPRGHHAVIACSSGGSICKSSPANGARARCGDDRSAAQHRDHVRRTEANVDDYAVRQAVSEQRNLSSTRAGGVGGPGLLAMGSLVAVARPCDTPRGRP